MAFISEIHYRSGDVDTDIASTHEFVEIALGPDDDPADFVLSFYGRDGALMDEGGIEATGVVDGEVTLSSLVGVPDPENPGFTIYTITSTSPANELVNATASQVDDEANFIALTNTATGESDIIGIGSNDVPASPAGSGGTPVASFTGGAADGTPAGDVINASIVGGNQSVQFDSDGNNVSGTRTPDNAEVICFCLGTQIGVPGGTCAVEDLAVGDLVETLDHGAQRIRWIGRKTVHQAQLDKQPKLHPVRISQGSLGCGLPKTDLLVSRQHRMMVSSPISKRMFGETNSLLSAIKLTEIPGIFIDDDVNEVVYFHILFDQHEVVFAEGAPSESLYLGKQAINSLDKRARREVYTLFPELAHSDMGWGAAAFIPSNKEQKALSAQHAQEKTDVLDATWR